VIRDIKTSDARREKVRITLYNFLLNGGLEIKLLSWAMNKFSSLELEVNITVVKVVDYFHTFDTSQLLLTPDHITSSIHLHSS
jgi:hypothetical protein